MASTLREYVEKELKRAKNEREEGRCKTCNHIDSEDNDFLAGQEVAYENVLDVIDKIIDEDYGDESPWWMHV